MVTASASPTRRPYLQARRLSRGRRPTIQVSAAVSPRPTSLSCDLRCGWGLGRRSEYSSRTLDHEKVWRATASMRPTRAPTGIAPINEPKHVKPSATKSTYATADARPVPPAEMLTSDWPSSPQPPIPPQSPEIRFPRPKARHSCDAWPRPYAFPRVRPSTSWSVRSDWSSPTWAWADRPGAGSRRRRGDETFFSARSAERPQIRPQPRRPRARRSPSAVRAPGTRPGGSRGRPQTLRHQQRRAAAARAA